MPMSARLSAAVSEELAALKEEVTEEAPDAKKSTRSFKSIEGSKGVLVNPRAHRVKWCSLVPRFPPNRKARSSASSALTETSL